MSGRAGRRGLEQAVAASRAALEEWTRERVPLGWAMTQNNLGDALQDARRAGKRDGAARGGGRSLSRGAGGVRPRSVPFQWAETESNLGKALEADRRAGEQNSAAPRMP